MRLVGRGWYQSLSGAYEEPPAMPVGYFFRVEVLTKSILGLKYATRCSASSESPDLVELKNFSTRLLTVENSASKIPLPV